MIYGYVDEDHVLVGGETLIEVGDGEKTASRSAVGTTLSPVMGKTAWYGVTGW